VSRLPRQTVITDNSPEIKKCSEVQLQMLLIKEEEEAQIAPAPVHAIKKPKDTMHVVDVQ
jgi:hypothetical protein